MTDHLPYADDEELPVERGPRRAAQAGGDFSPVGMPDFAALAERARAKAPPTAPRDHERERLQQRQQRMVKAGVVDAGAIQLMAPRKRPPLFRTSTGVLHPGPVAAMHAASSFIDMATLTLTLWGRTGTGKTWAGLWAVAGLDDALWLPMDVDFRGEGRALLRNAQRAWLVVVNDLGTEPDEARGLLGALISRRHDDGRRTIITSNLPPTVAQLPEEQRETWAKATLEARYGTRVSSRLCDVRRARVVHCPGENMRQLDGAIE